MLTCLVESGGSLKAAIDLCLFFEKEMPSCLSSPLPLGQSIFLDAFLFES